VPTQTHRARSAREERLDSNAITGSDTPPAGSGVPNLLDDPKWLMSGDDGIRQSQGSEVPVELLDVTPTNATRFDAEEGIVCADRRTRKLLQLKLLITR
jgi:hypothetical protein